MIRAQPLNGTQVRMFQRVAAGDAVLPCGPGRLQAAPRPYHDDVNQLVSNASRVVGPGTGLQGCWATLCLHRISPVDADFCAELKLNHDALAKLTVSVIVLVALLVWRVADRKKSIDCGANCPTDVSAIRKPAR
ncbi:hypothetical protein H8A95_16125 [Bradyrhizobium sp. Pear76]|uniref:hypothetical protein n=1 Tax=Bradyrhizobium oropedii TaxID=1571201 RepID=UPI001E533249|nr:hypothetical protein [Bradyrhizobium oropedii]MCC8963799.1 hypothetical protein [Bradyrhizobium oropedii]